jgi:hypothetical protein
VARFVPSMSRHLRHDWSSGAPASRPSVRLGECENELPFFRNRPAGGALMW